MFLFQNKLNLYLNYFQCQWNRIIFRNRVSQVIEQNLINQHLPLLLGWAVERVNLFFKQKRKLPPSFPFVFRYLFKKSSFQQLQFLSKHIRIPTMISLIINCQTTLQKRIHKNTMQFIIPYNPGHPIGNV